MSAQRPPPKPPKPLTPPRPLNENREPPPQKGRREDSKKVPMKDRPAPPKPPKR